MNQNDFSWQAGDWSAFVRKEANGGTIIDDEAIIRRAFGKDPMNGYAQMFIRYYAVLCSHAVRFVYSRQMAEDIVGEVYYKFINTRAYEQVRTSFRAYLFTSVRNECLSYLRKEFGKKAPDSNTGEKNYNDPHAILQSHELAALIERTVQALPPRCKEVFLLSRFEGKQNAEIAGLLKLTVKAVEAQITRAIAKIRSVLTNEYLGLLLLILLIQQ